MSTLRLRSLLSRRSQRRLFVYPFDSSAVTLDGQEARLAGLGCKVLPLRVKNCSVCTRGEENTLYNRVEVETKFDFCKVCSVVVCTLTSSR